MQLIQRDGRQLWNREYRPPWQELTVIGERPAVVRGRQLACKQRRGSHVHRCPYYDDCADNAANGGAVLCEALVVGVAGDKVVAL